MNSNNLCLDLSVIRDRELARGNEIDGVSEREFVNCDLLISLKKPFGEYYEEILALGVVSADVNVDPHYPIGKSYYCRRDRHAIFAPQQTKR